MVQKTQALLITWEVDRTTVYRSNEGLTFTNDVSDDNNDGDAAGNRDDAGNEYAQESYGRELRGGAPETRCYYYCKKEGHLKSDCQYLKVKRAAKNAANVTSGGAGKVDSAKGNTNNHTYMMLVESFEDFNTWAEDHFFFSQVAKKISVA